MNINKIVNPAGLNRQERGKQNQPKDLFCDQTNTFQSLRNIFLQTSKKQENHRSNELLEKVDSLRKKIVKNKSKKQQLVKPKHPALLKYKKRLLKKLKEDKKKRRRNTKKIQGMKVTAKMHFKPIPAALNCKTVPLDSKMWQNTKIDSEDPRMLPGLTKDIYKYLNRIERLYEPKSDFMRKQYVLSIKERALQVDWLLRLSHEMRLRRQTFYLAISMMDRYLELKCLRTKEEFDKLALTCLFTAAKYEELSFPTINDFVYLSGGRFSKEILLEMEGEVLQALGFRLNHCHPMAFFDGLARGIQLEPVMYHFAQFVIEAMIYKGENRRYKNSVIGASCLLLTLKMFRIFDLGESGKASINLETKFFDIIVRKSMYRESEIKDTARSIWLFVKDLVVNQQENQSALIQKFKKVYYNKIDALIRRNEDLEF